MNNNSSSDIYYSGEETIPAIENDSTISNKRQKTSNDQQQQVDPTNFLNFDYEFPLDPTAINQQDPEDFFMFVTDNEQNSNSNNTNPFTNTKSTIVTSPSPRIREQPFQQTPPQPPVLQQQQQVTINPTLQPKQLQQQIKGNGSTNLIANDPPNQAVHTIVVGGKTFRLSWESLKSDGPNNFFLEYFKKKRTKVMHIDRDPDIFDLIVRHLRGYYIRSTDDIQHQSLLFDATYYGLNRLRKTLQEYICINVGGRVFKLPWNLFQKDGTHNFFTGPLMHSLLTPHTDEGNSPPIYIDRDPDIFADIVNHLRGYTIHIRDEMHRKNLLRDAQYYVFRQLSDKILTAQQTVAGFGDGSNLEVLLLLQDIRVVNMLASKAMKLDKSFTIQDIKNAEDWSLTQIQYKRIVEGPPHALLVQVSDLCMQIHKNNSPGEFKLKYEMNEIDMKKMRNMARVAKATNGINMEIYLDEYCAITIDDNQVKSLQYCLENDVIETNWEPCKKCNIEDCQMSRLILQRAICGVYLIDNMIVLCALRLEAISSRFRLNLKRQFLSG